MAESAITEAAVASGRVPERIRGLFRGALRELAHPAERRNPYLDGLRTIAVLLVVNDHSAAAIASRFHPNAYTDFPLTANGWIGVDLFFVLSGYFIGGQLWRELDKTGTVSVGKFMIRRGLRIWPLYFFVFAFAALAFHGMFVDKQYGWSDLVFLTNYLPHGIVLGGWSLCTEEQFYLLTPVILMLVGRRKRVSYAWGLVGLFAVEYVVRATTYTAHAGHLFARNPDAFSSIYYPFHTHCDGLIAGLWIAAMTGAKDYRPTSRRPWLYVILGAVILLACKRLQPETLDFTGLALFFGALVWWGTQRRLTLFDSHIFYLISRLSFGMYLLHPYLIDPVVRYLVPHAGPLGGGSSASALLCFVLVTIATTVVSAVTFCLVEHPFLVLREAVLRRRTASPLVAT